MIAELAVLGLACWIAGFLMGRRAGRKELLKKLRIPPGCRITYIGYARTE